MNNTRVCPRLRSFSLFEKPRTRLIELERLAERGDAESQKELGRKWFLGFTEDGVEYEANFDKAIQWLIKAADAGNAEAQYLAGVCLFSGFGLPMDTMRACIYNNMATKQRYCVAVVAAYSLNKILGSSYNVETLTSEETQKALEEVTQLAAKGDPFAQFRMAACYDFGRMVTKDDTKANEYYKPAAEQGYFLAQANLAFSYRDGQGIEKNLERALYWFIKAGKKGHISSIINVSEFYEEGKGVPVDLKIASEWLLRGAQLGSTVCQLKLGKWYRVGNAGVEQDKEKAFMWILKAAAKDGEAMSIVGSMYADGEGTNIDWNKAVEYYEKSNTHASSMKAKAIKKRMDDWVTLRLLWLAWSKNRVDGSNAESCHFARLPKEILKEVIRQWYK